MEIVNCTQRSPEWFSARCGIPTASNFNKIITSLGKPSKQADKYLYQLAAEHTTQARENSHTNYAIEQGIQREEEARAAYSLITNNIVTEVGFCKMYLNNKFWVGASPDGLINADGLLEIKCPLSNTHIEYLLQNTLPSDYIPQVQGQLLVTGHKWCDFMSYYPGLRSLIIRVYPDNTYIDKLKNELIIFCDKLRNLISLLS